MADEKKRAYMRLYKRQQRERWREDGLCVMCGHPVEICRDGRATCEACSRRVARRARERRREGKSSA